MAFVTSELVGLKALRARNLQRGTKRLRPVTEKMHQVFEAAWRSGGEAFIRAAVREILIDTGMTAGTFLPLARAVARVRAVRIVNQKIDSRPGPASRPGIPTFPFGIRDRSRRQSAREGIKLGASAYRFGVGNPQRPVLTFQFETIAFQHAIHEPTIRSLQLGIDAFIRTVQVRVVRNTRLVLRAYLQGRDTAALRSQVILGEE